MLRYLHRSFSLSSFHNLKFIRDSANSVEHYNKLYWLRKNYNSDFRNSSYLNHLVRGSGD